MEIKLTRLFIAFFMRTEFMDFDGIERQVRSGISGFKKAQRNDFPVIPPQLSQGMPQMPLFSLQNKDRAVTVSSNKIEYSIDGIYDQNMFNDILGTFLAISKLFIPICVSDDNICGRIGMVKNSFLITDQGDNKLKKHFYKDDILAGARNISMAYVEGYKFDDIYVDKIVTISHGQIHLSPPRNGLLLSEDINIPKTMSRLDERTITLFIDSAGKNFESDTLAVGFKNV